MQAKDKIVIDLKLKLLRFGFIQNYRTERTNLQTFLAIIIF